MKLNPGDAIRCKKYGKGVCKKIDDTDTDFMYLCRFKDGTLVWLSKYFVNRFVRKAATVA